MCKTRALTILLCSFSHFILAQTASNIILINEILTQNYGSITNLYDEDGDSPDFIELYNTTNTTVDLSNWKLADDGNVWKFPVGTNIAANGYLSVWASGKDKSTGQLHTNFKLNNGGEYLGLYDANNSLVYDFGAAYPPQYNKLSYGISPSGTFNYFDIITKDAANANGYLGKVATPTAALGRGFYYGTSIVDTLTCSDTNATIRYTLDGTQVTASSPVYSNSLTIDTVSIGVVTLRTKAFLSGYSASDEISFSYVFPDAMYGGNYGGGVSHLPIISIQTNDQTFPECVTIDGEKICDREAMILDWVEKDSLGNNKEGFSAYAGVNVFGETTTNKYKRNFRVHFDPIYDQKYLEYPIFETYPSGYSEPTEKFRKFELRGNYYENLNYGGETSISEQWINSTRVELGESGPHSVYVNLFVNGSFRGIHSLRERFDHNFYESYSGVDAKDINALKADYRDPWNYIVANGTSNTWITMMDNALNSNQNTYQTYKNTFNINSVLTQTVIEAMIDGYGEEEFRMVGSDTDPDAPYRVIASDISDFFFNWEWEVGVPGYYDEDALLPFFYNWLNDPEFEQEVFEFAAKHFCGAGALTVNRAKDRMNEWKSVIDSVAATETAFYYEDKGWSYTSTTIDNRIADWEENVAYDLNLLNDLDDMHFTWDTAGLFQGCDLRPVVSTQDQVSAVNSPASYSVEAFDPDGDMMTFSVISGLPPGLSINSTTGEISGTPNQIGTYEVKIKVEDTNNKWGYHYFTWEVMNLPVISQGIVINEIMYHPDSLCVGIPTDIDLASYIELKNISNQSIDLTRAMFTDGIDFQFPQGTTIPPQGFYVIAENSTVFEIAYGFTPNAIYEGGLNNDGERLELSDAYGNIIDSLTYNDVNPWDEDPDGKGPTLELLNPLVDNSDPLNWFRSDNSCGTPGAENSRICTGIADAIVINEINYNSDNGNFDPGDWVELHNPNSTAVDISGWTFYDNNNDFIFPSGTSIAAGEFLVLVENDTVFAPLFPHLDATRYLGDFSFGLSNKGERVSLFDENKCLSDYVVYNDRLPWDTIPDGNGPALSLINPGLDNALPPSWESSSNINSAYGTPGRPNIPCPEHEVVIADTVYAGASTLLTLDILENNTNYTWFAVDATLTDANADSTFAIWNTPGTYNIQLITKYFECTKIYNQQVTVIEGCTNIELYAFLEGPYDVSLGEMKADLNVLHGLLPGQTPPGNLVDPTPGGQPYNMPPWNYTGTEGLAWTDASYTDDIVDWVLVSVRTDIVKNSEVGRAAGMLYKDGNIRSTEACVLENLGLDSVYIVLEHRNHMGIMTPQKVPVFNNTLSFDFRTADSYKDATSFGQKQLPSGQWAMFAGDGDQADFPSFDITGIDKTRWLNSNGIFQQYLIPDYNLDGDVNGADKALWDLNNGVSSRVPK